MSHKLVQVTHTFSERTSGEFADQTLPLAPYIAETPGLCWKLWMIDATTHTFSGLYLFEDEDAAWAYLSGPIMDLVRNDSTNGNLHIQLFDMMEEHTALTHGPTPLLFHAGAPHALLTSAH